MVDSNDGTPLHHHAATATTAEQLKCEVDLRMRLHCAAKCRYQEALGEWQCYDFAQLASSTSYGAAYCAYTSGAVWIARTELEKAQLAWHTQERADLIHILVTSLGNEMGISDDLITIIGQYMTENIDAKRYPLPRTQQ